MKDLTGFLAQWSREDAESLERRARQYREASAAATETEARQALEAAAQRCSRAASECRGAGQIAASLAIRAEATP